jgi:hypothetical protein
MRELDFLIIGAQKAGTTSLRAFLASFDSHIYMSRTEHHFWNRQGQFRDGFGVSSYMSHFADARDTQLIGEKSPSYLSSHEAPERIAKHFPKVKLIAILRNPVERAYSAYWHGRRVGAIDASLTFTQSIERYQDNHGKPYGDLVTPGLYASQINRYLDFFPRNQLLILDFDQLLNEPERELSATVAFLGLDPSRVIKEDLIQFPKRNTARVSRSPRLSQYLHGTRLLSYDKKSRILKKLFKRGTIPPIRPEDREFLSALYSDQAREIHALTGVTFDWKF